jgi:hypothetical protein
LAHHHDRRVDVGSGLLTVENPYLPKLFGEPSSFVDIVVVRHPDKRKQALTDGPKFADNPAVHRHRGRRDSLHQNPHGPMVPCGASRLARCQCWSRSR